MAISAPGVGSGLDVNSIVSQLVAIEKQPLTQLQSKATTFQSQLSLYGKVKSQASALGDAAALLAGPTGWNTQKASSSNTSAIGVIAGSAAVSTSLIVEVQQLARAQSTASEGVVAGSAVGVAGTLTLQLGAWAGTAFTAGSSPAVPVTITATDTVTSIASKINSANAGVTATVLRDGANERLVIRSKTSGEENGFRIDAAGDAGLSMFGFTDTAATAATGVTLQLNQVTTEPVDITVENDLEVTQKNIQAFVDAYNSLNQTLADSTKYDAATKKAGLMQADSTTVGLQNALRAMLGSSSVGSTYARLSDIGIERQTDGSLKVNATKLTSSLQTLDNVKNLFATNNSNSATNGFGLKVRDFARGLVAADGLVTNKSAALQGSISRNSKDQDRVNDRASRVETQLLRQYSALDAQLAQMNGLSSYVTAQLAQWNKSTS